MKKPTQTVETPPGGWKYTEPQTGVTITHTNFRAFMAKIFEHREANELFTGSGWKDDVLDLVCRQNPTTICHDEDKPERRMDLSDVRRFAITLSNWIGQGAQWVPQEEAERRATICSTGNNGAPCPRNKTINGCWGCKGALNWIVEMMGNRTTSRDADLQQCSACFCTLRAKCHIPLEVMLEGQEPLADLPEYCWMAEKPSSPS